MSVQNSLIKPAFTKSVMGYNTGEVDKYVEHVSERYNSVCRENAELKHRLLAEGVRLREAEEKIDELEKSIVTDVALDKSKLIKIFDILNAEKNRFSYFVESLKENLNEICANGDEPLTADNSWEDTLEEYVEEIGCITDDDKSGNLSPTCENSNEGFYVITDDGTNGYSDVQCDQCEYDVETDNVLSIFDGSDDENNNSFVIPDLGGNVFTDDIPTEGPADKSTEEENETADKQEVPPSEDDNADNESPVDTRTPAQIAADLDFYTDGDHADGESFDPMTLAAQITSRNSRPKFEDFIKTIPSDDN